MKRPTYKTYWELLPDFSRKELKDATNETRLGDSQETKPEIKESNHV